MGIRLHTSGYGKGRLFWAEYGRLRWLPNRAQDRVMHAWNVIVCSIDGRHDPQDDGRCAFCLRRVGVARH